MELDNNNVDVKSKFLTSSMLSDTRITSIMSNKLVSGPSFSNNAPDAVFTVKNFDFKEKKAHIDMFLYYANTNLVKQLTRNPLGSNSVEPDFCIGSPGVFDDSILFIKNGQLWQVPLYGGESSQLSNFPLSIETFRYFNGADNRPYVACVVNVFYDSSIDDTCRISAEEKASGSSGIVFDKLMVRHWDNWGTYRMRHHIFVCPLQILANGSLSLDHKDAMDIMFGLESDCPGKAPGAGREDFNISSDGNYLCYAARRTDSNGKQRHDFAWSTATSIYLVSLSDYYDKNPTIIHEISDHASDGVNCQPTFSPDSKKIAFFSMKRAQYESDKLVLCIYDVEAEKTVRVTDDVDISFQSIEWSADSSSIYLTGQYLASTRVFKICLNGDNSLKNIDVMIGDESKSSPVPLATGLLYLENSLAKPSEIKLSHSDASFQLFVFKQPTCQEIPVRVSDDMRLFRDVYCPCPQYTNGDIEMPNIRQHYFPGANGDPVHCWFLSPANTSHANGNKLPLVLVVHGGPQGAFTNAWSYRWNLAMIASQGYAVAAVNFHGSTGFGQAFIDSIRNDWGGKPYDDCMKCVDFIVASYPYVDGNNVAAMGASYGGYMMNWINGHTDRFKCLVNHDGIFGLKGLYFATDEVYFPEYEFGKPWENAATYQKWSPENYVENWHTPTLVIQGGVDYRVNETESIATFTALQRLGIDSQLLFFPDENHWVLKPANSMKWHATVFAWLKKYLLKLE